MSRRCVAAIVDPMATLNSAQRRPQPLSTSANGIPRPVITLDAWESIVPLQEKQLQSVHAWKSQCEQKPLPFKVLSVQSTATILMESRIVRRRTATVSFKTWYTATSTQAAGGLS
jgi:hypothetical protein